LLPTLGAKLKTPSKAFEPLLEKVKKVGDFNPDQLYARRIAAESLVEGVDGN